MKFQKIIFGLSILFTALTLFGCSEDIESTEVTAEVFGIISDLQSGAPLPNVSVTLYEGVATNSHGVTVGSTFTGTDGFFQLDKINPNKSYVIMFKHSGYKTEGQRVTFTAGKKTELNKGLSKQ